MFSISVIAMRYPSSYCHWDNSASLTRDAASPAVASQELCELHYRPISINFCLLCHILHVDVLLVT